MENRVRGRLIKFPASGFGIRLNRRLVRKMIARARASRCLVLGLIGVVVAISSVAGTQSGKIVKLYARATDGINLVHLSGPRSGRPVCATQDYWIIKDENSTTGKKQFAMLLMAQAAGRTVMLEGPGSGACTRWGDGEDIGIVMTFTD